MEATTTTTTTTFKNFRTRGKRPMRNLPLNEKVIAIQRIHDGETKASVSRSLGVPESTLRGWCKNENKLRLLSAQSKVLEGLADPLPEKRIRSSDSSDSNEEENNNNYKMPIQHVEHNNANIFAQNIMDFSDIFATLDPTNWFSRFLESRVVFPEQCELNYNDYNINDNSTVKIDDEDEENSCETAAYPNENSPSHLVEDFENPNDDIEMNVETDADNNNTILPDFDIDDNGADMNYGDATLLQWCQMFTSSFNLMRNFTSSIGEVEAVSVSSSQSTAKRVYDDPYNDIRTLYEVNKRFDAARCHVGFTYNDVLDDNDDDDDDEDADEPEDLSIRSHV